MPTRPAVVMQGDAHIGQRLSTAFALHELGATAELRTALEALRDDIAAGPRRGSSSLFVGPAGHGQALAAASLGTASGRSVLRVDVAALTSRYLGETEKNLARLFDQAARAGSILFLDEADAIFGKRTEVHDAHDRYADIETSYLLQQAERHGVPLIVAVRSTANIDPAYLRRLAHVVPFSRPLAPPKSSPPG